MALCHGGRVEDPSNTRLKREGDGGSSISKQRLLRSYFRRWGLPKRDLTIGEVLSVLNTIACRGLLFVRGRLMPSDIASIFSFSKGLLRIIMTRAPEIFKPSSGFYLSRCCPLSMLLQSQHISFGCFLSSYLQHFMRSSNQAGIFISAKTLSSFPQISLSGDQDV